MRKPLLASVALVQMLLLGAAQAGPKIGSQRASGRSSDVYSATNERFPGHNVVKIPRPGRWIGGRFHFRSDAVLKAHAERVVSSVRALGGDARSGAWFRSILPEVAHDPSTPGWIYMTDRDQGARLADLGPNQTRVARKEMTRAFSEARRVLKTRGINRSTDSFRFDSATGHVTAWFSPLTSPRGEKLPYELVGEAGKGRNSDAYVIKNHDPKTQHLTVLKVARPFSPGRGTQIADMSVREDIARDVIHIANVLRRTFVSQFGIPIIPETVMSRAPGVLLQERVDGTPYESLEQSAANRGLPILQRAQAIAQAMFPIAVFSDSKTKKHVLFDARGNPGWFDFLNDNKPWQRIRSSSSSE